LIGRGGVFVDSSAWCALTDRGDSSHVRARAIFTSVRESRRRLVTTNLVIGESYTVILGRAGYQQAQAFLQQVRTSPLVSRAFVSEAWEAEAEELLRAYSDHAFSYVDATSFVAMRRLGIREAFAFDRHFSIAGFTVIDVV
jgi:predicted nucleic acid-binding protein